MSFVKSSIEFLTLLVMKNLCTIQLFQKPCSDMYDTKPIYKHDAYVLTNLAGICNLKVTHRKGLVQNICVQL